MEAILLIAGVVILSAVIMAMFGLVGLGGMVIMGIGGAIAAGYGFVEGGLSEIIDVLGDALEELDELAVEAGEVAMTALLTLG